MPEYSTRTAWVATALAGAAAGAVLLAHDPGGGVAHLADGRLHDAYAYEFAAGMLPPGDPRQLGAPPRVAWMWHVALASLSGALQVPPWRAATVLSAMGAASLVATMWVATGLYTRKPLARAAFAAMPMWLANPFAPLVLVWTRPFGSANGDLSGHPALTKVNLTAALVAYDPFAVGASLVAFATLLVVTRIWETRLRVVSGGLIGFLAALLHPPSVLAIVPLGLASVFAAAWENRAQLIARAPNVARESAPGLSLLSGIALAAPAVPLASWLALLPELPAAPGATLRYLAPGAVVGLVAVARWGRITRTTRLLAGAVLGIDVLALITGGATRDALVLLGSPADALLALALLDELVPAWRGAGAARGLRTALSLAVLTLAGVSLLGTAAMFRTSSAAAAPPYTASGTDTDLRLHASAPAPRSRQDAWRWIRENTPATAVILEDPQALDRFDLPVVTRRRALVSAAGDEVLVERASRVARRLSACELGQADLSRLFSTTLPWPPSIYAVAPIPPGGAACKSTPDGVSLVYKNPGFAVYVIRVERR
jgi:hypothetical protein